MRNYIFVTVGVALLALLLFIFKPIDTNSSQNLNQNISITPLPTKIPTVFEYKVEEGEVTEVTSSKVTQGDNVVIKIRSDQNDKLHIHGYDQEFEIKKGEVNQVTLIATSAGRFALELHDLEIEIGFLNVLPR